MQSRPPRRADFIIEQRLTPRRFTAAHSTKSFAFQLYPSPLQLHSVRDAEAETGSALDRLNRTLGIPENLAELGVSREMVGWTCERALADHSRPTNPRTLIHADYAAILEDLL